MPTSHPGLRSPSADLIAEFTDIVGPEHAIQEPDAQQRYLHEWRERFVGKTPLVLRPASTDEVSRILALANTHRIGVVPQAGNTGLVGGQIPRPDAADIVVSVERLSALRNLEKSARHMTVEAGVTLAKAHEFAGEAELQFPLNMASEGSACIGGAIATNSGGVHVLAYGNMRALTLGIEAVMANGDIWDGLRALKKDNTGYALKDLLVGSEGTLGIITAATLKLFPVPASVASAFIGVESLDDVSALFSELATRLGPELTAFEFMSAQALDFVGQAMPDLVQPFAKTAPWTVLIEVSSYAGNDQARQALEHALTSEPILKRIQDSALAASHTQAAHFWRLRDSISEAQKIGGGSIKHDISVPIDRIPSFIGEANALVTRICPGARPCPFGHFGDGNIHYNVSQPEGGDKDAFLGLWTDVQAAVHDLVIRYDGSISAEHGIGIMKRAALRQAKSAVELDAMRAIKSALDPHGILNPGKLL